MRQGIVEQMRNDSYPYAQHNSQTIDPTMENYSQYPYQNIPRYDHNKYQGRYGYNPEH